MKRLSEAIPTPNEFLARIVEESGISRNSLARMIGVEATRVQRWISHRELIPRHHLAEIARQIGLPGDEGYMLRLKDCEDFVDRLSKQAADLASHTENVTGEQIKRAMLQEIEDLLSQEIGIGRKGHAEIFTGHLLDANFAIQSWLQVAKQDYNRMSPLFSPTNVARHLRHPVNHFIGVLLNLKAFQEEGLANIHRIVEKEKVHTQAELLVRQHATHILARHGSLVDREFIREVLQRESTFDDLMKRSGFVGLILVDNSFEVMEQFLIELEHGPRLAMVNNLFEAVHYGDIHIEAKTGLPFIRSEFNRTVPHVLRHLEQLGQYQNILALEIQRLLYILETVGPKPFLHPQILMRLANVLVRMNEVEIPFDKLRLLRTRFMKDFRDVLEVGGRQGIFDVTPSLLEVGCPECEGPLC